jgi:ankyrin repeat protein
MTPLHYAVLQKNIKLVEAVWIDAEKDYQKAITGNSSSSLISDARSKLGMIHHAIKKQRSWFSTPSPANFPQKDGFTPVNFACLAGDQKILDFLVEKGGILTLASKGGITGFHLACQYD